MTCINILQPYNHDHNNKYVKITIYVIHLVGGGVDPRRHAAASATLLQRVFNSSYIHSNSTLYVYERD